MMVRFRLRTLLLMPLVAAAIGIFYRSTPVGLERFCPVTLVNDWKWRLGKSSISTTHNGQQFYFGSQSARQTFLANPDRYAPAWSGFDPVRLIETGERLPGQRALGLQYQDRVLLFASDRTLQSFTIDPERYFTVIRRQEIVDAVQTP